MAFRTNFLTSVAVFALTAGSAVAENHEEMTAETVVASVDGADITLGQLIMLRSQLPAQYQELSDDLVFNGLVEQLVNQQLLANTLDEDPLRVEIAITNERRSLRAGEVVNDLALEPITDEALQEAYDARFEGVGPEQEYNASHILVETEEEANEIIESLEGGADFAETAAEKSTGPSGPNGGELGWFGAGMMVPEFEAAVVALETGELSEPIQTQFGWHVVKLNDSRETSHPTLDDLRDELTTEVQQEILNELLETLTADADITLPEEGAFEFSVIQNLELLDK